jgi:hypothetical protein
MATSEDLEARVRHLEFQVGIMRQLTVREKYPFGQYALEAGLTEDVYDVILRVVEEVDKHLTSGGQMTFWEFVERLDAVAPDRGKDGKFARSVLASLHEGRQFREVYDHMMSHGMMVIS